MHEALTPERDFRGFICAISSVDRRMDGQACLNRHANIRRATVSEGRSPELSGTANSVSCTVSHRNG